jgi:hypothetical protein
MFKGQNNANKGHLEPMEDAKKEPYKQRTTPKTLGCKSPSKPHK